MPASAAICLVLAKHFENNASKVDIDGIGGLLTILHNPWGVTEAGLGIRRLRIAEQNGSGRGTARVQVVLIASCHQLPDGLAVPVVDCRLGKVVG